MPLPMWIWWGTSFLKTFTFSTSPEQLRPCNQFCLKAFLGEERNKFVKMNGQTPSKGMITNEQN